jgi:hypothetical protein
LQAFQFPIDSISGAADGVVDGLRERRRIERAGAMGADRVQQLCRTHEAADMLGVKPNRLDDRHPFPPVTPAPILFASGRRWRGCFAIISTAQIL